MPVRRLWGAGARGATGVDEAEESHPKQPPLIAPEPLV